MNISQTIVVLLAIIFVVGMEMSFDSEVVRLVSTVIAVLVAAKSKQIAAKFNGATK